MSETTQVVLTPTAALVARRAVVWIVIVGIVAIVGLGLITLGSATAPSDPMSGANPAPDGAQALVEVLRHEGVDVTLAASLAEARAAVRDPEATTVFLYDQSLLLNESQTREVLGLAHSIVVLEPSEAALELISPQLAPAGFTDTTAVAGCSVDAARAAEKITVYGSAYRVLEDDTDAQIKTCFDTGDRAFALVEVTDGSRTYAVLGASDALTNGVVLEEGNAALGLNLLGADEHLVWYLPGLEDYDTDLPTAAELAPDIVVPISLLAFIVAFAAMLWRGRRLGPLVVENLPVVVRASETMRGRARLYEKANARLHTLDSLRIGTLARLANLCGLSSTATVDEVVSAAAAIAKLDPHEVRRILVDADPASDAALVRLSDELLLLEKRLAENLRPH